MFSKKLGVGLAVLGLLLAGSAAKAAKLSSDDENFVIKAKLESQAEIDLGTLADSQSDRKEVKEVASHIVDDHRKMDAELDDMVHRYGVTLTDDEEVSGAKEHAKLALLKGKDFDDAWVSDQLERHHRLLDQYKTAEEHASDDKIKEYAKENVETIRIHLKKLEELQKKISS